MSTKKDVEEDIPAEYPSGFFADGTRGKYFAHYQASVNIVKLAPDLSAVFRTEDDVIEALRILFRD